MDAAIFIHRELEVDARNAALYANTISKAKDLNISIEAFRKYIEDLKKDVLELEKDEAKWVERYREFKFRFNTLHLKTSAGGDRKTAQAEKKRYAGFIELYEEYLKYSNFIQAWERYEEKKSAVGALDYGDLNRIALTYLDMYGTEELNERFRYIIIDEFQDTNYVQFELIKKLTEKEKNITVVADPNQTIYAFRGAYTDNIGEYRRQFSLTDKDIVSGDFTEIMKNTLLYQALKIGEAPDFKEVFNSNWEKINPAQDAENILGKIKENKNGLKFNPTTMTFSYSSISTYEKCPRQYELKELLRMPTRDSEDSTGAMNRGTFVHKVLEMAVSEKITTKERLYEIRDTVTKEPDFRGVDIETATAALDVFWERNKNRIANNLMVEQRFAVPLGGFTFKGFIDRVDLIQGTKNEIEIIDYKTGKSEPGPDERSKQLLLYARGIEHVYPQYKVKRLTLEQLALPNPRTFELNGGKFESARSSRMEGLDGSAIDDMIEIAKKIAHDYEHGFGRTKDEKACGECGYRLYCGE